MKVREFNVTPKRLAALRLVAASPRGMYVSAVAEAVLTSEWRKEHRTGYSAQMATRAGAGYVAPLIKAGLLWFSRRDYGHGVVSITTEGQRLIDDADKVPEESLDSVIARCIAEPLPPA